MAEYRLPAALRDVGAELKERRVAADLSLRVLAEAASISSHSRVAEMEKGLRRLTTDEYERIMRQLGVSPDDQERILSVVRSAEGPGQLSAGPPDIGRPLATLIDYEASASRITGVAPTLIPGLLQTSDYARAILGEDSSVRLKLRAGRRDVLTRSLNPVRFHAIVDSEVLVRPIGSAHVMLDQLQYLLRMAELPNITVQVVSSTRRGYNPMLAGPFELIEFPKAQPIVHLEHHRASAFLWEEDDVRSFVEAAEFLRKEVALSPEESRELIAGIVKGKETT